ncbi:hypothetical protein DFH09DRAFT_1177036 [Mycena vulgaris]|nr:hypothetical protein DFH09DRAFT_1177036 [Mycena vulgaris]
MSSNRKAVLKLTFVIVGGGLSGLACGYALRNAGHDVVVVEENNGKHRTEGSIRAPPNMTRILSRWPGMTAFLQTHATKCSGLSFRDGATSEPVGFMKFHEAIMAELEAEFLVIQHDDLRRHLTSLCLVAGVVVKHGKAMNINKLADGSVTVVLDTGTIMRGDIVVGADGHNSVVRSFVLEADTEPEHIVSGVNISISTKLMQKHEELRPLCNENQFTIWMGNDSSITGVLDSTSETFTLAICSPTELDSLDGDWYENYPLTHLPPFDLSGYDPRLHKLIQLGHSCHPTVHKVFEQEDVVGLDASVVLVGDAAHSVLIHGSHNSSMAIEDALTLGTLFSHLSTRKQIPIFLDAYQELRHARTHATQTSEYQSLVQISLPRGAAQAARDEALLLTLNKAFEDFENCEASDLLVQVWEQYLVLFSHDAGEAVDNWWTKWNWSFDVEI